MANTFSQIYIQTVFAVSNRQSVIKADFKEDLYKYITRIVRNQGQKLIAINGMPDHVHILIGLRPAMALADLVQDIKADSSNFINKKKWVQGKFSWQEGYGAFSYGHSQLNTIIQYIQHQEKHHHRRCLGSLTSRSTTSTFSNSLSDLVRISVLMELTPRPLGRNVYRTQVSPLNQLAPEERDVNWLHRAPKGAW